ncbi:DUF3857 domain-containing protein [Pseudokordiimonas caeni]|uniref:DUF3857 domain-containing protein n=1 Tax=Pseudokordiimonas caeni TaxID=2997908 RepID=UPI002811253B|nr:DUF3857 domain-containing protein [Pseudokordiimonas caeni]
MSPPPDWVKERTVDFSAPVDSAQATDFFLSDLQMRAGAVPNQSYQRLVFRMNTIQAVQSFGNLRIVYFPAFQKLAIHHVHVVRNGQSIDMLPTARVTYETQQTAAGEPEHEGATAVNLFLADVRRGDTIDYALTFSGQNEAFGDHVLLSGALFPGVEMKNVFHRVLVPKDRDVRLVTYAGYPEPTTRVTGDWREYETHWPGFYLETLEPGTPVWVPQVPVFGMSDFPDWAAVRQWAEGLFNAGGEVDSEVASRAAGLVEGATTRRDKLERLLRFMQAEIRYVGMEIGRNGFRPFAPAVVLDRRYGDCKDQAMLLVAMLHSIGIDAKPVLVNSGGRHLVELSGPAPTAFDHLIVRVDVEDGTVWVDPTMPIVNGAAADFLTGNFGTGLVVDDKATALEEIPDPVLRQETPDVRVADTFDLPGGLSAEGTWTRRSTYVGRSAKEARLVIENMGQAAFANALFKLQQNGSFKGIDQSEVTQFHLDGPEVVIIEKYRLPQPGEYDAEDNVTRFSFRPRNIVDLLRWTENSEARKTPVGLPGISRRETILTVNMPGMNNVHYVREAKSAYHDFRIAGRLLGDTLRVSYKYDVLADQVEVRDVATFNEQVDKIWRASNVILWTAGKDGTSEIRVSVPPEMMPDAEAENNQQAAAERWRSVQERFAAHFEKSGSPFTVDFAAVRQEVATFLDMPGVEKGLVNFVLMNCAKSAQKAGRHEDAVHFLGLLKERTDHTDILLLEALATSHGALGDYAAAGVALQEILKYRQDDNNPDMFEIRQLYERMRVNHWLQGDLAAVAADLEALLGMDYDQTNGLRELAYLYDRMGDGEAAARTRARLSKAEISEWPASAAEGSARRQLRIVFQPPHVKTPEIYRDGIEGYAKLTFDVLVDGTTTDCKIVEAYPEGYFEKVACDRIANTYYFPAAPSEPQVEVRDVPREIDFSWDS